jgi:hypothetical protein
MSILPVILLFLLYTPQCSGSTQELHGAFQSTLQAHTPDDPIAGIEFIQPDDSLPCPNQPLRAYLLNQDPLVIYIENFISANESDHLIQQRSIPPINA